MLQYVNINTYFSSSTKIAHGLYTKQGYWKLIVKPKYLAKKTLISYYKLMLHYVNIGPYFSSSTKIAHGLYTKQGFTL